MAVSNSISDNIKQQALNTFDSVTHMGFGTDGTAASPTDSTLGAEVIRKTLESSEKNVAQGTFLWESKLTLAEGNGNIFQEVGTFDVASGGSLYTRDTFTPVNKTSDVELVVLSRLKVEVQFF